MSKTLQRGLAHAERRDLALLTAFIFVQEWFQHFYRYYPW